MDSIEACVTFFLNTLKLQATEATNLLNNESYDKFDIILLGSTDKETSIYASSDKVERICNGCEA